MVLIDHHLWTSDGGVIPDNYDELVTEVAASGPEGRARADG